MSSFFNHQEVLSAAPDSVAMALGVQVPQAHPLAASLSLRHIAEAAGMRAAAGRNIGDQRQILALGLSSGEFSKLLSGSAQQLAVNTYRAQSQHGEFCTPVPAKNFNPVDLPSIDVDVSLEPLSANAEIVHGSVLVPAGIGTAKLSTYAKIIGLSREAVYNDYLRGFGSVLTDIGASAARLEARLVANALMLNPVMDDGQTVFDLVPDSDSKNNVVASALTGPALGEAMQKLRTQITASGTLADLASKHLLVAPDLEFLARSILRDFGLAMQIHVLAYLPAGRWFLLCDVAIHPVVGTLYLEGSPSALRVQAQVKRPDKIDGAAFRVIADLGVTMLSRTGIVRGGLL